MMAEGKRKQAPKKGRSKRELDIEDMIEPDARRCTSLMGSVYYRILNKIEKKGYRIYDGRVGLSLVGKVGLVARAFMTSKPTWMDSRA